MLVVPSVLDELAFLCDSGDTDRVRQSALQAMKLVREQDRFRPLLELASPSLGRGSGEGNPVPRPAAGQEVHDSLILAEAALLGCGLLFTSDEHLRGVDHEHLTLVLNPFELVPPVIASPREIVEISSAKPHNFIASRGGNGQTAVVKEAWQTLSLRP